MLVGMQLRIGSLYESRFVNPSVVVVSGHMTLRQQQSVLVELLLAVLPESYQSLISTFWRHFVLVALADEDMMPV